MTCSLIKQFARAFKRSLSRQILLRNLVGKPKMIMITANSFKMIRAHILSNKGGFNNLSSIEDVVVELADKDFRRKPLSVITRVKYITTTYGYEEHHDITLVSEVRIVTNNWHVLEVDFIPKTLKDFS